MPYKDPQTRRAYNIRYLRVHYRERRSDYIEMNRLRKRAARIFLWELKQSSRCTKCGEPDPRCLDFHHENHLHKSAGLSQMATDGAGLASIRRELSKCVVLCKNCHARTHFRTPRR